MRSSCPRQGKRGWLDPFEIQKHVWRIHIKYCVSAFPFHIFPLFLLFLLVVLKKVFSPLSLETMVSSERFFRLFLHVFSHVPFISLLFLIAHWTERGVLVGYQFMYILMHGYKKEVYNAFPEVNLLQYFFYLFNYCSRFW